MRSSRTIIEIGFNERVQLAPGVWEDDIIWQEIRAEEEFIFQSRFDKALADGQVLSKRFKVRSYYVKPNLDYVIHGNFRYKVRSILNNVNNHYAIIECGELV